ncbi:MAG: CHAD domain-containing protein, partial [Actinomycetes bacterium]
MAAGGLEVERKYDAPAAGRPLPDLTRVPGVAAVEELDDGLLEAVYYDTPDLRLARSGATLRRRTGGRDAGWHPKLPATAGARHEITAPLRGRTVPVALAKLARSRSRGAPLAPVAQLRTTRSVLQLRADDGRVLAELADDTVLAELVGEPTATSEWRELEVELVDGDDALLDAVETALLASGARRSGSASKLGRLLGERTLPPPARDRRTAGDAVLAHLREHVDELVARDPLVRRDEPDSVHKMRVATRRLRSALKTFRPLLDRERTDPLRDELKHLAGVLGAARDAEVLRDRLLEHVHAEPAELVLGPVAQQITDDLGGRYRRAHRAVVRELDGARYLQLLEDLSALVSEPPLTERAQRKARKELPRLVGRMWHRLRAARAAADAARTDGERAHLLHEVRKTAKQARYAGEAVAPVLGRDAARFAA